MGVDCGLLGVMIALVIVSVTLSPGVVFPQPELEKRGVAVVTAVVASDFADSAVVAVVSVESG